MPARRVVVIVNASRPATAATVAAIAAGLRAPTLLTEPSHTLEQARRSIHRHADRADVILFAGGDGTFTMGLSLLAEACRGRAHPTVGVVPLGTGNAMAHAYDIPIGAEGARAQIARALDPAARPREFTPLQVAGVHAPFCGFGLDARLVDDYAATSAALRRWGAAGRAVDRAAGYALSIAARSLPALLLSRRPRVTVTNLGAATQLDAMGQPVADVAPHQTMWEGDCTMAAVATIPCFGFGLRMFPFAQARPDRFQVRASDAGLLEIVRNTRAAFAGRYTSPQVHDFLADRIRLSVTAPAPFEAGGESLGHLAQVDVTLGQRIPLLAP